ncbi:phage tail domain-containing protein [Weissella paramesenteroides]|uniref:phage tail domain-containing protein n=1 Tax=Weissella paramesenteroides TaxID=1249 RepID=UPI0018DAA33C|nr:phage tail domain-containing protein [Weissella paramesenteroides]QPI45957.1 phage tail family protein [Weissella paramesenteroides]
MKGQDEFDITERLPDVVYLGGDSTPTFTNNYQDDVTQDGSQFTGTTFGKLIFTANFLLHSHNFYDQKLLRHEIYQLFGDRELVRFRTDIDLEKVMYGRPTSFDIKFVNDGSDDSLFSIQFEIPSGYKYSFKRSDETDIDELSFGMNFQTTDVPVYTQYLERFRIFNPSDIAIDPYYQRHDLILKIKFTGDYYQISNQTNGTSYKYNDKINEGDQLILNGLATTLNGTPASQNSDFGYIKLEKGWNDITVSGATSHETTFSFPFIYID